MTSKQELQAQIDELTKALTETREMREVDARSYQRDNGEKVRDIYKLRGERNAADAALIAAGYIPLRLVTDSEVITDSTGKYVSVEFKDDRIVKAIEKKLSDETYSLFDLGQNGGFISNTIPGHYFGGLANAIHNVSQPGVYTPGGVS